MRFFSKAASLAAFFFLTGFLMSARSTAATTPPRRPLAVIFRGPTICAGCEAALQSFMEKRGFVTRYVTAGETTPELLRGTAVYLVGGGEDVQDLAHGWNAAERRALRAYVKAGGRYFGACLGAYWASNWKGEMPGFVSLDITPFRVRAFDPDRSEKVIQVNWLGRIRSVYFQDGPAFTPDRDRPGDRAKVYATYADGSVAAFTSRYGQGRVAVTGVHVEADQSWYDEAKLVDPDGIDADLMDQLLDDLLR